MKRICLFVPLALLATSCVKDKPQPKPSSTVVAAARGVLITNEGNFGAGNASISYYDPASGAVAADYYRDQNSTALGDVVQSVTAADGKYYIVVNNSGTVLECDEKLKKLRTLKLPSPRYLLRVSPSKLYVSDYSSGAIAIVDASSFTQRGKISCAGWTEQMALVYGKVFVTNERSKWLYIVDAQIDRIADSVDVGYGASSLAADRNDRVWVLAGGDPLKSQKGRLTRLDAAGKVEWSAEFSAGDSPRSICFNPSRDTLYFMNGGIYRMAISRTQRPSQSFIGGTGRNFYGLGVQPRDGNIYVSDAIDYLQRSDVYRYDAKGNEVARFKAGINANGFVFE